MSEARILVVEDEQIVAFDLKRRLERLGYTVPALLATGEEAIQQSADLQPDLVLMDIKLKGDMDGIEAAQEIRDRLGIRVVYLTAFADSDTRARTRDTSASGFKIRKERVRGYVPI